MLEKCLGFDPCKGQKSQTNLVRKIIQKVPSKTRHRPTSLTDRVHLDLVALVTKGMFTRTESATLHAHRCKVYCLRRDSLAVEK